MTEPNQAGSYLAGLSNDLATAVKARRHTPATGIHWRRGVIVTADHTIQRDTVNLTLPNGSNASATIAGRDGSTDLAVLKADVNDLAVAQIGDDAALRVGHIALAVARPGDEGLSASWGTISGLGGPWRSWSGGSIDRLIRPDVTLYPGFSGGPLVDPSGRVVGLNTSGLSRSLALTIPATTVNRVVDQLLARGHVPRGYLGVALQSVRLPENLKSRLELQSDRGLIVVSVESDGPAEKAGVLVGDILLAVDGRALSEPDALQSSLDPDKVGKQIQLRVLRGGESKDLTLTVGERPRRGEW